METKYLICAISYKEGTLPNEFFVLDRDAKKVFIYQYYHDCKDVTKHLQRQWEVDKNVDPWNRRCGYELIEEIKGSSHNALLRTILATDDARKVTSKVCEFRAKWFAIRQKRLERLATSESAGYESFAEDSFIAEHFIEL